MENNKLLAEYLGLKMQEFIWDDVKYLIPDDSDPIMDEDILYWNPNKDWNQLMMVVEKIEEGLGAVIINRNRCEIYPDEKPIETISDTKIEAVYNACVEYIKK